MRKHKSKDLQPQQYEHRTECALQSLIPATSALHKICLFLREQMGDEWRDQDKLLEEALVDLVRARRWIKKALKK